MTRKLFSMFVLTLAAVLSLAACASDGSDRTGGSGARDSSTIKVDSSSLGDILVDGSGHALYLFTPDGDNATSSKCDAACLEKWPAFEGRPKAGDGVDASLIGTTTGDGTKQATYAGHPLYYFANDKSAGDVNGQGIGKVWYVLDGKGAAVMKTPAATGGGGY